MEDTYKLVAVLNKKLENGKLMNALAHMSVALAGTYEDREKLSIINYQDKDGGSHMASKNPFIVLSAKNSNKLRAFRNALIEKGIHYSCFTNTMTVGTWQDQVELSKNTLEEELEYYGVCAFGKKEDLDELTKKFSLFK